MPNILVFEDREVEELYPVTLSRPAYAVTCACFRFVDFLAQLESPVSALVRPHLTEIQRFDFPFFAESLSDSEPVTVLLNARIVPSVSSFAAVRRLVQEFDDTHLENNQLYCNPSGNVVAAVCRTSQMIGKTLQEIWEFLEQQALHDCQEINNVELVNFPHELIHFNQKYFSENLSQRLATGEFREIKDGLFVAADAKVSENIVADTNEGAVVIDSGTTVGPYSYFAGPVYVGRNCKVIEHSAIKDYVCLGHTVKAGGEIEAAIIEPYSNKQHHGFLGHAYLGSWINLGAGTCNSDLKNTYGHVNVTYGENKVSTQTQFFGCVVGDYAKTAINSSIFTGKIIGVCSNIYGFVPNNVPSFVNFAKSFGEMTLQSVDVMKTTQARMFARRNVQQRPCDIQLLMDMFALTKGQRPEDLSELPPSL